MPPFTVLPFRLPYQRVHTRVTCVRGHGTIKHNPTQAISLDMSLTKSQGYQEPGLLGLIYWRGRVRRSVVISEITTRNDSGKCLSDLTDWLTKERGWGPVKWSPLVHCGVYIMREITRCDGSLVYAYSYWKDPEEMIEQKKRRCSVHEFL